MNEDLGRVGTRREVDVATAEQERARAFTVSDPADIASVTYGELVRVRKQFATYLLGGASERDPLDPKFDSVVREMFLQFRAYPLKHCRICSAISPCLHSICAWGCGTSMMWPRT